MFMMRKHGLGRGVLVALAGALSAPLWAAEVPVTVVHPEALLKTRKLVLGNFVLEFQNQYIKTRSGFNIMGLGSMDKSTATNSVTLPDAEVLQALTDFAYLRVQDKLREQGYEVVMPDQLSEGARTAQIKLATMLPIKSGAPYENRDGTSVLYAPTGVSAVLPYNGGCDHYVPLTAHKNLIDRVAHSGTQMSNATGANEQPAYERKIALAEGAPVLKVWITVGFGDVEANGAGSFISKRQTNYSTGTEKVTVTNAANAKATSGMFLRPAVTRFALANPSDSQMNWNCGISVFNAFKPPADGEVQIQLADKYRDDGSEVVSLSNQAASIGVTSTAIGGGMVARTVKENDDATGAQTAGSAQAVQVTSQGSTTSGRVDVGNGMGTVLNTRSQYATSIRADYYATSVIKMVEDVTSGFIGKMK